MYLSLTRRPRIVFGVLLLAATLTSFVASNNEVVEAVATTTTASNDTGSNNNPSDFFGGQDNQDYVDWVNGVGTDYVAAAFLPSAANSSEGVAIHWGIISDDDGDAEHLELGLAVRAKGWLGFGLTENGGMTGADMLLYEAWKPDLVTDAYVLEQRLPQPDTACHDWHLLSSSSATNSSSSNFLMIQVRRKLDTGDSQDLSIRNDKNVDVPPHHVIAAWGDDEAVGFHGSRNARGSVRWFVGQDGGGDSGESTFLRAMDLQSDGSFFVGAKDFQIKPVHTKYKNFCVNSTSMLAAGVPVDAGATIVGFEPVADNTEHIHHFVLRAGSDETCNHGFTDRLYVWTTGNEPQSFPKNVGFQLGGQGYNSLQITIHYNNPELKEGAADSSGVKVYYSEELREHQLDVLALGGMPQGSKIGQGLASYEFLCPANCSAMALDGPVTVLQEMLHMHHAGVSAYNEHIRDGQIIRTGKVDFFDSNQQGAQVVKQDPFVIQPGDSFNTRCFYRNENADLEMGLATSDEMCTSYLLYYPRAVLGATGFPWKCDAHTPITQCTAPWKSGVLTDETPMQRTFGIAPSNKSQCHQESDDNIINGNTDTDSAVPRSSPSTTTTANTPAVSMNGFVSIQTLSILTLLFVAVASASWLYVRKYRAATSVRYSHVTTSEP